MDKRRLCVKHPFRVQANLTRSWCNEVALCRTSSLQQALSPVPHLSDTQLNSRGPHTAQLGQQVGASDPTGCRQKRDASEFSREKTPKLKVFFSFFLQFQLLLSVSLVAEHTAHCSALSIRTASARRISHN